MDTLNTYKITSSKQRILTERDDGKKIKTMAPPSGRASI